MLTPLTHSLRGRARTDIRTEDIRFSPSGRRIAAVATEGLVRVLAVDLGRRPVRITAQTDLRSNDFKSPHGVDFLTEDLLIVANRQGRICVIEVPPQSQWSGTDAVEPICTFTAPWFGPDGGSRTTADDREISTGPGSARVHGGEVYICCNNRNTVSVHPIRIGATCIDIGEGRIFAEAQLDIPDGVAISRGGEWLAVSDHGHQRVLVWRRAAPDDVCVVTEPNLVHPHGLTFGGDGLSLFIADAGERHLHVFRTADRWTSDIAQSAFSLKAVSDTIFARTRALTQERYRYLEGGLKGIDLDPSGQVLVTTCRHQTLRFFEVAAGEGHPAVAPRQTAGRLARLFARLTGGASSSSA